MVSKKILDLPETHLIKLPRKTDEVFVRIFVNAGRFYETDKNQGISHLLDHYINGLIIHRHPDINSNAFVYREHLRFDLYTTAPKLRKDVEIFLQNISKPSFSEQELIKFEQQALANELRSEKAVMLNNLEEQSFEAVATDLVFCRNIYREVSKTRKITLTMLREYHQRIMTRQNIIVFVGAFKLEAAQLKQLRRTIEKYFCRDGQRWEYPPWEIKKIGVRKEDLPRYAKGQAIALLYYPGFSFCEPIEKRVALSVLCWELSGTLKESPFSDLRKLGVYGLNYYNWVGQRFGVVTLRFSCLPSRLLESVEVVENRLAIYQKEGISKKSINFHRQRVNRYLEERQVNSLKYFTEVADDLLNEGRFISNKEVKTTWARLNEKIVKNVAREVFRKENQSMFLYE